MIGHKGTWWIGVVEDRDDPEQLGRCKVRIFGYHTEDPVELPTKDLPWALPLQPITSAAISGKGSTPIGPLEGTWVVGWFLDGEDMQQPIMMGTIAGKNKTKGATETRKIEESKAQNDSYLRSQDGEIVRDSSNEPIVIETSKNNDSATKDTIRNSLPPLTPSQIKSMMNAIAKIESSSGTGTAVYTKLNYKDILSRSDANSSQFYGAYNSSNYWGKYQFGYAALIDLGYVKNLGNKRQNYDNTNLLKASNWENKNGLNSLDAYINNGTAQESIMFQLLERNYNILKSKGIITTSDTAEKVAGLLAAAHNGGAGAAVNLARGLDSVDGNGTPRSKFYTAASRAVGGSGEEPQSETDTGSSESTVATNKELLDRQGFADPNKVYPTLDYYGSPDTNKLARGLTHPSLVNKEWYRSTDVNLANSSKVWEQPKSPYSAKYPYNHVVETEAGHLLEFDNTPGHERINLYHKSGTFIELDVNGTSVRKTVGDSFELVDNNSYTYIRGGQNITVDGSSKLLVKNNADIQVLGTATVISNGSMSVQAAESLDLVADVVNISGKTALNMTSGGNTKLQGKDLNLYSSSNDVTIKSKRKLAMQSLDSTSINGGFELRMDASVIKTKMGATAISEINLPVSTPPSKEFPTIVDKPDKVKNETDEKTFLNDDPITSTSPEAVSYRTDRLIQEIINDTSIYVSETSAATSPQRNTRNFSCNDFLEFDRQNNFPSSIILSKNYTLSSLLFKNTLVAQKGISRGEILCNMKYLAEVCLEPIKAKYADMIVTSCFRVDGRKIKDRNGREIVVREEDHARGMAADMQFNSRSYPQYFEVAKWIEKNIPHAQLLLEYERRGTIVISWIHIAFDKSNKTRAMRVGTLMNHVVTHRNQLANQA